MDSVMQGYQGGKPGENGNTTFLSMTSSPTAGESSVVDRQIHQITVLPVSLPHPRRTLVAGDAALDWLRLITHAIFPTSFHLVTCEHPASPREAAMCLH